MSIAAVGRRMMELLVTKADFDNNFKKQTFVKR